MDGNRHRVSTIPVEREKGRGGKNILLIKKGKEHALWKGKREIMISLIQRRKETTSAIHLREKKEKKVASPSEKGALTPATSACDQKKAFLR